jgi:uncharacterized membrane protein YdjX (TVP38/TMEM64 family)
MFVFLHRHRRLLGVLAFLLILWGIFEITGVRQNFNLAYVQLQLQSHPVVGLLAFVLLFVLGNLVQIPGGIFLAAAVLALGQWMGGIVTYVAASTSCLVTFVLIRWVGGNVLRTLDNKLLIAILSRLDAHPVQSIALSRIVFQTLPALNYGLAMSGVKLRDYMLGTLLGLPLPIALYCIFFDFLATRVFHIT